MLGWCSLAAERISRRKRSSDSGPVDQVAADDLEHLLAAHQRVLGQVDHAHAAAAQLADDLVVGMVGQARRERVGRGRCRGVRALGALRATGFGPAEPRVARRACASRTRSRKLSADSSATRLRQSGHCSRCSLTASAEASSSLPRPNELRVWSVGWSFGGAFIGESPGPVPCLSNERYITEKAGSESNLSRKSEIILSGRRLLPLTA